MKDLAIKVLCEEIVRLRELHDEEGFQIGLYDKELKEVRKLLKDVMKDNAFYHKENEVLKKACKDKDEKIAQLAKWIEELRVKPVCRRVRITMEDKHGND